MIEEDSSSDADATVCTLAEASSAPVATFSAWRVACVGGRAQRLGGAAQLHGRAGHELDHAAHAVVERGHQQIDLLAPRFLGLVFLFLLAAQAIGLLALAAQRLDGGGHAADLVALAQRGNGRRRNSCARYRRCAPDMATIGREIRRLSTNENAPAISRIPPIAAAKIVRPDAMLSMIDVAALLRALLIVVWISSTMALASLNRRSVGCMKVSAVPTSPSARFKTFFAALI